MASIQYLAKCEIVTNDNMGQKCVVAEYYDVIVTLTKCHHFILLDVCVFVLSCGQTSFVRLYKTPKLSPTGRSVTPYGNWRCSNTLMRKKQLCSQANTSSGSHTKKCLCLQMPKLLNKCVQKMKHRTKVCEPPNSLSLPVSEGGVSPFRTKMAGICCVEL